MNPPQAPPPLPSSTNRRPLAHQAAVAGLVAPLIAIVTAVLVNSSAPSAGGRVIAGLLASALFVAGLVAAVIALCGMREHGKQGLLGRGVAGVLINGLFVVVLAVSTWTAFNTRLERNNRGFEAQKEMEAAVANLKREMEESFDPEAGITNVELERVNQLQKQMAQAGEQLTGDRAIEAKAVAAYLARMQEAGSDYQKAITEVREAHVLEFNEVSTITQLQARRAAVERMTSANHKLLHAITNSEALFAEELAHFKPSKRTEERLMAAFRLSLQKRVPILVRIRNADFRMADGMLGAISLLETNWGSWRFNQETSQLNFDKDGMAEAYNRFIEEIDAASASQIKAQKLLLTVD